MTVRRLRGGSTLVHPTRAHGHVLSGRLQAHNTDTKKKHISSNARNISEPGPQRRKLKKETKKQRPLYKI